MNEAPPDVKDSTIVFKGRVFTVAVDTVAYPDGRIVKMDAVRHRGSVVLIPMPAPDRIILIKQYRYVVDQWLWELPAGSLDPHETLDAAARRECHEEIGKIAGRAERLGTYFPSPGFCDEAMNFFLLTELRDRRPGETAAHQDPDELLEVKEFSLEEARAMVKAGEIVDMKTMVGLTLIGERGKG
jgi:ADP-ribose pyrophosphatase